MKIRIDNALAELGLARSRTSAQNIIKEGIVAVNGKTVTKPSQIIDTDIDKIELTDNPECTKYVGRGGFKLEKAIDEFGINLNGKCCMDIGASTGGFTDCMLKNGAKKIFAVDVGKDQLDNSLRQLPQVISLEQLDIRDADNEITESIDFFSIDVSFISLKHILPELRRFSSDKSSCVALIKPQFENGKSKNGKNGVIRDPKIHKRIIDDISGFAEGLGFGNIKVIPSPIEGGDGNREFLMYLTIISEVNNESVNLH